MSREFGRDGLGPFILGRSQTFLSLEYICIEYILNEEHTIGTCFKLFTFIRQSLGAQTQEQYLPQNKEAS